jgi:hypothetical protein
VPLSTLDRWSSHHRLVDARNAAKSADVLDVELPRSSPRSLWPARSSWV